LNHVLSINNFRGGGTMLFGSSWPNPDSDMK
jgi:hypothetical protein